jgi:hypothetical protein
MAKVHCPKCQSEDIRLCNVRIGKRNGKIFLDPSAYGECNRCGKKFGSQVLQAMLTGHEPPAESWWGRLWGKFKGD